MLQAVLLVATLLGPPPGQAQREASVDEVWAEHQVLSGKRKVPLYGEKDTHTENFLIADVHRTPGRIDVVQKLCRVDISPIKSVLARMKPETVSRLPRTRLSFAEKSDGTLTAEPWSTGWGAEDIDGDGHPGATVEISGTCSGEVYVSNQSTTTLLAGRASDDELRGQVSLRTRQKLLGASGFCLKLMAGDSDETQTGWFAMRRVPAGSTCQSLEGKPWPVKAQGAK